jgi:hypothetical protein
MFLCTAHGSSYRTQPSLGSSFEPTFTCLLHKFVDLLLVPSQQFVGLSGCIINSCFVSFRTIGEGRLWHAQIFCGCLFCFGSGQITQTIIRPFLESVRLIMSVGNQFADQELQPSRPS